MPKQDAYDERTSLVDTDYITGYDANGQTVRIPISAIKVLISNPEAVGLGGLNDVTLGTLANGNVIVYNSTSEEWENGGILDINDIENVSTSGMVYGQVLRWNITTEEWENSKVDMLNLGDVNISEPDDDTLIAWDTSTNKWISIFGKTEGTWTPTVEADMGSITAYTSSGTYFRSLDSVTITCSITLTTVAASTTGLLISGLPISPSTVGGLYPNFYSTVYSSIKGTDNGQLTASLDSASSELWIYGRDVSGSELYIDLDSGDTFNFSLTYKV